MATDRQLQETVARCVSAMVYYHNCGRSGATSERMAAEVQLIAGFVVEDLELGGVEAETAVVRPLEFELIERYGHEVGPRLLGEFLAAFECVKGLARPRPADESRPGRAGSRQPAEHGTSRL